MSFVRRAIGRQVKKALYTTGLQAGFRRIWASSHPVILRYHSVDKANPVISQGIAVSPSAFEEQVRYFARHFQTVSMSTLVECIRQQRPFPNNALVLTFDDGYADNFAAAEVLHRYGLTGLFYVTAGCIETEENFWVAEIRHVFEGTHRPVVRLPYLNEKLSLVGPHGRQNAIRQVTSLIKTLTIADRKVLRQALWQQLDDVPPFPAGLMLSWQQLEAMVAMGMEIGGHTLTHPNLPSATPTEAWDEILGCKALLELKLGVEIRHFAYPNGGSMAHYNAKVKALVRQAGFWSASTSTSGRIDHQADLMELRRLRATEFLFDILWEMEGLRRTG